MHKDGTFLVDACRVELLKSCEERPPIKIMNAVSFAQRPRVEMIHLTTSGLVNVLIKEF